MYKIDWHESYRIGIPALDADHEQMVDMMNGFFRQLESGGDEKTMADHLHGLIALTRDHFEREESLMDQSFYAMLPDHKAEHDRLLAALDAFRERRESAQSPLEMTLDTANFLRGWLVDHIMHKDQKAKPYVMRLT